MKLNINYDGLRALGSVEDQRKALFSSIKAALLMPYLAVAVAGDATAAKAASHHLSRFDGASPAGVSVDAAKNFLLSNRADKFGAKWATPGDNPALIGTATNIAAFYAENIRELDLGYQVLFDEVPGMLGSDQDHFDLIGASMGFTWEQIKAGGAIKPRRNINENSVTVKYLTFGDGFSILDEWFRFSKYYHLADAVNEFASTYFNKKAELHYNLITGQSAAVDVAFDTDAATTFNKAVAGILRKCEKKGYAIGANAQVDILVSPERAGYVLAFLDATRGSPMIAYGTQKQPIAFSVRNVIVTTKVAAADTGYYVVLPGRKLKRADWTALTIESKREPSVSAEDWYGRGQYNAIAGDADQIARVKFAS